MQFPDPLVHGVLIERYKRFFADVRLDDGREVVAHCPNPGAMLGLKDPGLGVWLSPASGPKRSLAWTLELMEADGGLVGVNTHHPNRLVAEALAAGAIPELAGYPDIRREVRYGAASRVDFLLMHGARPPCWLEVKNVHFMRRPRLAEFPDCTAARSAKHLRELSAMTAQGDRAVVLFVVQREDCDGFSAAADIDPAFARGLEDAADAGVEVLVYRCAMGGDCIALSDRISWRRAAG